MVEKHLDLTQNAAISLHTMVEVASDSNQEKGSAHVLDWMGEKFGVNRLREKVLLEHIA